MQDNQDKKNKRVYIEESEALLRTALWELSRATERLTQAATQFKQIVEFDENQSSSSKEVKPIVH